MNGKRMPPRAFVIAWLALFAVVLVRTAWIGDDAYITFRTIDNFIHGYGLRWNVAERVQAYTHPLWMALITAFYWFTREPYFTTLAVSIALTIATLWLLVRASSSMRMAAAGLTILLCSRAFIDYSTSGLENPLTNLLLVLFILCYVSARRRPLALPLLAAALMLTRLDAGLLVLPALAARSLRDRRREDLGWAAIGFLPLIAWELFSVVYYGVPFPNTAYAKLRTAIPEGELLRQGFLYLVDSVRHDPVTPLAIFGIAVWTLIDSPRTLRPIAAGILIGVLYVTWVGGDFMSGRMFAAPLVMAVACLVVSDVPETLAFRSAFPVLIAVLGFNALDAAFLRAPDAGAPLTAIGITDERMFYFPATGLVNYRRGGEWPRHPWVTSGLQLRAAGPAVIVNCCNGMLGYSAGPQVHIIDTMALADPLLSRLPAQSDWRIGHFGRAVPRGYRETLETGANRIADPNVAAFYDRLVLVIRGAIWDRQRLTATWHLNTGGYDRWLARANAPPSACDYAFLIPAQQIPAAGGTFNVIATAPTGERCDWRASTSDAWLRLTSATSGSGVANLMFTGAPNPGIEPRTGTIALNFQGGTTTFKVVQNGLPTCTYAVEPTELQLPASATSSMFEVKPSADSCAWKVQADASWISITAGVDNTGRGTVQFVVQPNASPVERIGHISVAGFVSGAGTVVIKQSRASASGT
jgi:arabinofuranosyltransferase